MTFCRYLGLCFLLIAGTANMVLAQQPDYSIITPENAAQLERGFVVPVCDFNTDWSLVNYRAGTSGEGAILDVLSGERLIRQAGSFSPAGNRVWIWESGIYDTTTWEMIFPLARDAVFYQVAFSPDGTLFTVSADGVYDTTTGKQIYRSDAGLFSPDGKWLAGDWLYDAATGWRYFPISSVVRVFSPDSSLIALFDGVYEIPSGQLQFATHGTAGSAFSPDGSLVAAAGDGVYAVASGDHLFDITQHGVFSPDSSLIAVMYNGVYDSHTGERLFPIAGYDGGSVVDDRIVFHPDGTLVAVGGDGVYAIPSGERLFPIAAGWPLFSPDGVWLAVQTDICTLYGVPGNNWPDYGLVKPNGGINVRVRPNGGVLETTAMALPVFARNADSDWYKVSARDGYGWVSASAVEVVFLPDNLPVETPQ